MIITVFEDTEYDSLFPINLNRASFELRCGAFTNLERIENILESSDTIQLVVRDSLVPIIKERYPNYIVNPISISPGIWLNGRGLWTEETLLRISSGKSYTINGKVIAIHNQSKIALNEIYTFIERSGLVSTAIEIKFIDNIWDGIFLQSEFITRLLFKKGV